MQPLRTEPFPVAAARDLLGLVRALYLVWRAQDAGGSDRLRALESVGLDLRLALDNARVMRAPNTPQQAAAWMLAERAIATLGEHEAMGPVVAAAAGRVRKGAG